MMQTLQHIFLTYIYLLLFFWGGVFIFGFSSTVSAQSVTSFDSIAGYGTEIVVKDGESNAELNVLIVSPSNVKQVNKYSFSLDSRGKSSVIIPSKDTEKSGEYRFVVVKKNQFYSDGIEDSFTIFPDDPSVAHSQLFLLDNAVETGKKSKGTAILYDRYQNPIEGHRLKIYSSRDQDRVTVIDSEKTNKDGEVSFFITSHSAGSLTISVENNTGGGLFPQSPLLRFYTPLSSSSLSADLTASASDLFGNVSRFEIDFPTTVTADSDESYLTLRVLDSDGNIVKNFVGTVKIMIPTDKNAIVPGQEGVYTFLEKDQGEILFSRSVVFPEKGKHSLEVYAYDEILDELNYNIFAKQTITVEEKSNSNPNANEAVVLLAPSDKSTFADSSIAIRGAALANSNIKIVLDENPVLEVEVDGDGKFIALLKNVSEGDHLLYVYQKEDISQKSEEISFLIDTKVSGIVSSSFEPHIAKPGESIEVTVIVEDENDVDTLNVFWNGKTEGAKLVGKNTYQLVFPAPQKEGVYPLKVSVTDTLQNSISTVLDPDLLVQKDAKPLGDIKNLKAQYDKKTKILTLTWDRLQIDPLLYIIHSGVSKESLQKVKSVSSKITKAELLDLSPGKYFFSVSAVNPDGSEGKKSEIISYTILIPTKNPTPTPTPTPTVSSTPIPTKNSTPTPTSVSTPTPVPSPQLFLTPQGNSIQASWEKDLKAENYRVSYGLASRSYSADFDVPKYMTSSRITDLIPGVRYFVLLESLDTRGNVIFSYKENSAIPLDVSFHPAPTPRQPYPEWVSQTGPRLFLLLGGLFLFLSAWYITKRDENIS